MRMREICLGITQKTTIAAICLVYLDGGGRKYKIWNICEMIEKTTENVN